MVEVDGEDENQEQERGSSAGAGVTSATGGIDPPEPRAPLPLPKPRRARPAGRPWRELTDMLAATQGASTAPYPVGCGAPAQYSYVAPEDMKPALDGLEAREQAREQGRPGVPKDRSPPLLWAHVVCGLHVPGASFGDPRRLTPIEGVEDVNASRWQYVCRLCHTQRGAITQCEYRACGYAAHASCAQAAGFQRRFLWQKGTDLGSFALYCRRHDPRVFPHTAVQLAVGEHEAEINLLPGVPPPLAVMRAQAADERRLARRQEAARVHRQRLQMLVAARREDREQRRNKRASRRRAREAQAGADPGEGLGPEGARAAGAPSNGVV